MQMSFFRLAESALFCANFAVAPAGLICLACGVIGAVPIEERPSSGILGDSIELLILHLRMPDAETWIAHTATRAAIRLGEQQIQDYLLISNGLMHRTPCTLSFKGEGVDWLDSLLLEQLSREGIGLTDTSTVYIATAQVQHSYTELIHYITQFQCKRQFKQVLCSWTIRRCGKKTESNLIMIGTDDQAT